MLDEAAACFDNPDENGEVIRPLPDFAVALNRLTTLLRPFLDTQPADAPAAQAHTELVAAGCRIQHRLRRIRQSGGKTTKGAAITGQKAETLDVEGGQTTNH